MIKSDKWIRSQCMAPNFVVNDLDWQGEKLLYLTEEQKTANVFRMGRAATTEDLIKHNWKPMIAPFVNGQVRTQTDRYPSSTGEDDTPRKIVSYGLSSFGYDVRLADEFKIFTNINGGVIDPLNMEEKYYHHHKGAFVIIPPNSYVLGHTIERFSIGRDTMVICVGKSTYARCGAIVNVTPIEAGFDGQVVIEISNSTNLPLKVHANQGIAQFLFFQSDEKCETSYADRKGKYQNQTGIQTALV